MGIFGRKVEELESPVVPSELSGKAKTVTPTRAGEKQPISRDSLPMFNEEPEKLSSAANVSDLVAEAASVLSEDYSVVSAQDIIQMTDAQIKAQELNLLFGILCELRRLRK